MSDPEAAGNFTARVREAVIWRSGSQAVAQLIAYGSTFLVIRLLDPADYGLFAMTQVVLVLLNLMNGYGIANALIRAESVSERELRQAFGMMILLNFSLGLLQFLAAPFVADYYREPLVEPMLRAQAFLYLATPFLALPHAVLSRRMDFKRPAQVRFVASLAGAATALACALSGWGVWTLVAAPFAIFYVEAIGMTWAARSLILPSFRFAGAGPLLRFGGAMMLANLFGFFQSQSDVLIAGRVLDAHALGIYTTALFLTQILVVKFVPPLNEVAFAAYARLPGEGAARTGPAFLKATRLILLVVAPAYLGLVVSAEPLVLTMLGGKWAETVALVPILAVAMPLLTMQILFAPATNAAGKPRIAVWTSFFGGLVLPLAFLIGIRWGVTGLAWGWVAGTILLFLATAIFSMRAIGVSVRGLASAAAPALLASVAMAGGVAALDALLPAPAPPLRLALLTSFGIGLYFGLLAAFGRGLLAEAWSVIRLRPAPAVSAR